MDIQQVCVYCASSQQCDQVYLDAAWCAGGLLARHGLGVIYGGGGTGLMGALADGALAAGGQVVGVIPHFMLEREWGHKAITELRAVDDMHVRKRMMIEEADAFVALPGGCGTLEELLETITWKRLGLHRKPIVLVNVAGFFDPLIAQLSRCIDQRFMDPRHGLMWQVTAGAEDLIEALSASPPWGADAIDFASL